MAGRIEAIWAALRACFEANKGPLTRAQVLAWVGTKYPQEFNVHTVGAQLSRACANWPSMEKYSTPKFLIHNAKARTYALVVPAAAPSQADKGTVDAEDEDQGKPSRTFALEAHLRDYLAQNLGDLESGLTLWAAEPPSVEYLIGSRYIDILAKDVAGLPVVIELKLRKGYDRVVGQALLYRGLLAKHLAVPRVRLVLIAAEISEELRIATRDIPDLELFEYSLSMSLAKLPTENDSAS